VATFDPTDSNSYNHSSGGITVYDSPGVSHIQVSYFVKGANPNEWTVRNYVDGQPLRTDPVTFDNSGKLVAPANGKVSLGTFTPTTGAGQLNMTLDINGSTQYGEVRPAQYPAGRLCRRRRTAMSEPAWSTPAIPTATTSRWARSP
jgi:flagellar hook protein FlgE